MREILSTIGPMRLAAIETSSDWCSVALWADGEITGLERRALNRHSELALPMLERLLGQNHFQLKDLHAVAFGAGPGSFTGLRIACGLAQGLALARGLPVIGVSSFEAVAEEAAPESGARVAVCIDARMREIYYSALEKRDGAWREVLAGQCVAPAAARLPPGDGWVGAGSGFAASPDLFKNLPVRRPEIHPSAVAIARLAAPRLAAGEGVDAAQAAPLYLRDKVAYTKAELQAR
jgi:tRNA threonylcarbamoyladenosine biosynthesis protein TsaB